MSRRLAAEHQTKPQFLAGLRASLVPTCRLCILRYGDSVGVTPEDLQPLPWV
jgi:hypothetical protein